MAEERGDAPQTEQLSAAIEIGIEIAIGIGIGIGAT
jgi:hypothetical protein